VQVLAVLVQVFLVVVQRLPILVQVAVVLFEVVQIVPNGPLGGLALRMRTVAGLCHNCASDDKLECQGHKR
jgi:ABC-type microcin C transport system permease subunit YejB